MPNEIRVVVAVEGSREGWAAYQAIVPQGDNQEMLTAIRSWTIEEWEGFALKFGGKLKPGLATQIFPEWADKKGLYRA